tara:strand:- start:31 stop:861 length:831 start_codon:yes stop_codon:yes gene_type:complete
MFDGKLQPMFAVGRQSKSSSEAASGVLYYPMQTLAGPNGELVVNDQTKQPAQAWSRDGLYLGSFFDGRAEDGRPAGFYHVHGNDNQGGLLMKSRTGKTYWLMPYQGHNRLYEITGWQEQERMNGRVQVGEAHAPTGKPTGLRAEYFQGVKKILSVVESPIFYERFGAERHAGKIQPGYKVVWDGFVEPPFTDLYRFHSLLGIKEQVWVSMDGRLVHAGGLAKRVDATIHLTAGHRHRLRIEYVNPDGRAELKLLWSSRTLDLSRLDKARLFPDEGK